MYQSPIELLFTDIHHQIVEQQEEQIYQAVIHFVPNVNREELLRALKYDRGQYDKGYADGVAEATPKWIPVTERLPGVEVGGVLCITKNGHYKVLEWLETFKCWSDPGGIDFKNFKKEYVTHWMPLPEPPKEGDTA